MVPAQPSPQARSLPLSSADGRSVLSVSSTIVVSMLWGIVFFSHQFGSFLGGWGAGRLYDVQGNYHLVWWISVGLGIFAAVIHWLIRERPVERLALAAVRS